MPRSAGNQGNKRTVALSSTEAEYMALSEVCKEAVHLKRKDRRNNRHKQVMANKVHSNWQGTQYSTREANTSTSDTKDKIIMDALKLARNPVFHARSKHIDIRYWFTAKVQ
ncbi:hypothetical protein T01_10506 [Trichinella spiralis]|uniref:Retrovirus-related Pol polyprotein from transposon TNT 1-94 n=1 Tax=Trichinella spiralis TaxID=6334 RepID=A0A0V1AQ82_TRISP|nr:hypothetical protein T01_10506 [Trichinella spiralis]